MRVGLWFIVLGCTWHGACFAAQPAAGGLRLNQIQVVGTHNSYHLRPPAGILKAAIAVRKDAKDWDYSRQPLDQQLDQGVRNFELDLNLSSEKGWQVMHVPGFDGGTTVPTFRDALETISRWSKAHPRHVPISLLMELKEEGFQLNKSYRRPTPADVMQLDEQLRAVFPGPRLLSPDDVRGQHKTLWEAVHAGKWPTLADAAGKVFAILHENGANRAGYLEGHPALEGRAMFVESDLEQPHSAVLIRNNPNDPAIDDLARAGYLIRTRVDSQGNIRAAGREQALRGGAHILTTDYPHGEIEADRAFGFPRLAPARVNPVTGPTAARGNELSEPIPESGK
ncbi:MAG TPA: Ca2+-dependent phosphoinositide-specific phospholipase C [Pirellulales bacterium]|nr:Ca2+-dependent phosphoinositide-specific phospholipase C [Pirellulales bacterium]